MNTTTQRKVSDLGKYRLVAELARGGMGVVYLAAAKGPGGFNKLLVVKELRAHFAEDRHAVEMFLDEAKLSARLSHPNVVQTYEVGSQEDRHYLAMEYLDGQTLHRLVKHTSKGKGPLSLALHLRILVGALEGLHYAHDLADYDGTPLNVVHRDVSPQNIFITYEGQVKLVDFGIAKANDSSSETKTGILKGKVAFMAPEQARGERADRRADIFAVGVLMAEALSGKKFWEGLNDTAILHRLLMNSIPEVELPPGQPEALRAIARRALAFRPEDRYPTAEAMLLEIEGVLGGMGPSSNRDLGKLMLQLFSDRRREIKAIIDGHLRQVSSLQTSEMRAVDLLQLNETLEKASSPSLIGAVSRSESGATFAPQAATLPPGPEHPVAQGSASRRLWLPLTVAVGFGLVGVAGTALWFKSQDSSRQAALAASVPSITATRGDLVPAASPGPAGPTSVSISLRATPPTARLILDNVPLPTNPYLASRPSDGGIHELRIEAPGFASRTEKVHLDRDLQLELALDRDPAARDRPVVTGRPFVGAAPKTAEPVATATAPATAAPEPRLDGKLAPKPKRDIDLNDPYKQP